MFLTLSEGPNDLREVTTIIIDITEIIEEIIANDLLSVFLSAIGSILILMSSNVNF